MTTKLTKLWLNELSLPSGPRIALRADFDNDYHMEVVVDPPFGPTELAHALHALAEEIDTSPQLEPTSTYPENEMNEPRKDNTKTMLECMLKMSAILILDYTRTAAVVLTNNDFIVAAGLKESVLRALQDENLNGKD